MIRTYISQYRNSFKNKKLKKVQNKKKQVENRGGKGFGKTTEKNRI